MNPEDLEGFREARCFAKALGKEIANNIKAGMTEKEIEEIAAGIFRSHDVKQHWHMPIIGVGEGSAKLKSAYALASSYLTRHTRILEENDLVLIDIAPIYNGYPSDYTTNHMLGSNPDLEALISYARDISHRIASYVSTEMAVADVFRYTQEVVKATRCTLAYPPFISLGHRLCRVPSLWQKLPEQGLTYLLLGTKGSFITSSNHNLMSGLWTVEPYLIYKERAAKFETLVYVGRENVILDVED